MALTSNNLEGKHNDDAAASLTDDNDTVVGPEPAQQRPWQSAAAGPIRRTSAQLGQWCVSKMPLVWSLLPALVATLMAAAIVLSKPAAHWMGPLSFLTYPFIHLFYYPNANRTVGGQLELFCIGLIGGTIGCAISFLFVACAVWIDERCAYSRHPDQPRIAYQSVQARTIGAMSMLVVTFGAAYIQSAVPRLKPGTRICLFDMIWIITVGATEIKASTFLDLFWPTLCSGGVCLLAMMLVRPKTANQVVVQQLTTFLKTVDAVLEQTTSDFFNPPPLLPGGDQVTHGPRVASSRLISLRVDLLKTLTSIGSTFHAALYELSFARISARQYAVVLPILGRIRTWIACGMGLDVAFRAPIPPPMFGGKGLKAHARPVAPRSDPLPSLPLPGQRRMLAKVLADHLRARQSCDPDGEHQHPLNDDWENSSSVYEDAKHDEPNLTPHANQSFVPDPWMHGRATIEQFEPPVLLLTSALHDALCTIIKALAVTTGLPPPGSIPDVEPPPRSFWGQSSQVVSKVTRGVLNYFHLPTPPSKSLKVYAETLAVDVASQQAALCDALGDFGHTLDTLFSTQFRRSALVHAAARAAAEKAAANGTSKDQGDQAPHRRRRSSDSSHEAFDMDPGDAQVFLDHLAVFDPDMYSVASLLVSLLELAHEVSSFLGLAERGVQSWLSHKSRRIHLPLGRLARWLPSGMSELGPAVLWSGLDEEIRAQGMSRTGVNQDRGGSAAAFTATVVEEGLLEDALYADADARQAHQEASASVAAQAQDEGRMVPSSPGNRPERGQHEDEEYWTHHDPKVLFPLDPDTQWVNRARAWANDGGKPGPEKPSVFRDLFAKLHA